MKVKLSEIRSSKRRVRRSWDVDKLTELTRSIEEQGILVPVKLRPTDGKYDIVFGHRRVAAAREAGLEEIEAIVEGVDDDTKYIQALTENVVREDMAPYDIALALKVIKDATGYTNEKTGEMFGCTEAWVRQHLNMLDFELAYDLDVGHVREARAGTLSQTDAEIVLKKASEEELSHRQTRAMAEEFTRAKKGFGKRGADAVIEKPWLTEQPTTATLEEEADRILKQKPVVLEKKVDEGEILFSWVTDVRVIRAEQALKDVSSLVSIMIRSGDDPGGAKQMIMNLRKLAKNVIKQMDDILKAS